MTDKTVEPENYWCFTAEPLVAALRLAIAAAYDDPEAHHDLLQHEIDCPNCLREVITVLSVLVSQRADDVSELEDFLLEVLDDDETP